MEGTLLIVGGGLTEGADEVFSALIERAGGPQSRFAFIVTASGSGPDETYRSYRDDFVRLGVPEDEYKRQAQYDAEKAALANG